MAEKRVFILSDGANSVACFRSSTQKDGKTVDWHSAVFSRSYQDTSGEWKRSSYFSLYDLYRLRRLLDLAIDKMILLDGRPNGEMRTALGESICSSESRSETVGVSVSSTESTGEVPF